MFDHLIIDVTLKTDTEIPTVDRHAVLIVALEDTADDVGVVSYVHTLACGMSSVR